MRSVAMCAPLGRVVLFGASAANPGKRRQLGALAREVLPMRFFNLLGLFPGNVGVHAINMLHLAEADPDFFRQIMLGILAEVAAGKLKPVIAERFTLSGVGAAKAHHYIQDRKNIGKILLVRGP
jgi:NADPH:quinone reductase-like Zn-dependent oxidoreductase